MENIGIAGTKSQLTVTQRLGILPIETVGQNAISPSGNQGSRKRISRSARMKTFRVRSLKTDAKVCAVPFFGTVSPVEYTRKG